MPNNPSPHEALRAELDAMVRDYRDMIHRGEGPEDPLSSEPIFAVSLDLLSKLDAALAQVAVLTKSLEVIRANSASQLHALNAINAPDDDLERINARWYYTESGAALSNTSATAQQTVQRIEREALEKAWELLTNPPEANPTGYCGDSGNDWIEVPWNFARWAILGEHHG